jgi:YbbR domain-containing protein
VEVPLSLADVDLPSDRDLTVRSVEPNKLLLEVDKEVQKGLPLRFSFTGEPAAGARVITDRVTIEPPQVTVAGPSQVVRNLESLDLTPINLDGHALSFEETASVIPPAPAVQVLSNPRVTVRVPMIIEDVPRERS